MSQTAAAAALMMMFASPAAAEIVREGNAIYVSGKIDEHASQHFAELVDDDVETVFVSGPGGYLLESYQIALMIQQHRLATMVPAGSSCASGCTLIWSAGVPRTLGPASRLGVHCGREGGADVCSDPVNEAMAKALRNVDAPPLLIARQGRMKMEMTWITEAELDVPVPRPRPPIVAQQPRPQQHQGFNPIAMILAPLLWWLP